MAKEITIPQQATPIVGPLYLPEIYWLLVQNNQQFKSLLEPKNRIKWESDFLDTLGRLDIKPENESQGSFWSDEVSKVVSKLTGDPDVQNIFKRTLGLKKFCPTAKPETRIDQKFTASCESI